MTANEKTILATFLDVTGDHVKYGHAQRREAYAFTDDDIIEKPELPLAYMIEEPSESSESIDSDDSADCISADVTACKACPLAETRTRAVPGEGSDHPLVMVIGEGPGADEDREGRPFVGRAGQLLDKMLLAIGLDRNENCYIANMVKCRPPGNRDPEPGEVAACSLFLKRQIALLRPRIILCAGRVAARNLLKTSKGINALRGEFSEYRPEYGPDTADDEKAEYVIPVLCTFHPSAVLRDDTLRRPAWEDLKLLKSKLDSLDKE